MTELQHPQKISRIEIFGLLIGIVAWLFPDVHWLAKIVMSIIVLVGIILALKYYEYLLNNQTTKGLKKEHIEQIDREMVTNKTNSDVRINSRISDKNQKDGGLRRTTSNRIEVANVSWRVLLIYSIVVGIIFFGVWFFTLLFLNDVLGVENEFGNSLSYFINLCQALLRGVVIGGLVVILIGPNGLSRGFAGLIGGVVASVPMLVFYYLVVYPAVFANDQPLIFTMGIFDVVVGVGTSWVVSQFAKIENVE